MKQSREDSIKLDPIPEHLRLIRLEEEALTSLRKLFRHKLPMSVVVHLQGDQYPKNNKQNFSKGIFGIPEELTLA